MASPLLEKYRQAYRHLDVFPLFEPQEIEAFFVEYGKDTLAKLEQAVDDANHDGKIIFTGHRGCGKSTLLKQFANQMGRQGYFVVFFSIAEMVEMSAVDHINILYAIAIQLVSKATRQNLPIPRPVIDEILNWLSTVRTETSSRSLSSELGVGGDLLKFITAKLKNESTFREDLKRTFERRVSDLVEQIEKISGYIRNATDKDVLVMIDDLDKLDLKLVEDIFKNNINALCQPPIRVVFTIPIAVIRDLELRTVLQTASGSPIQQMEVTKFFTKDDRHNATARPHDLKLKLFLDVLRKRFPEPGLIEDQTAHKIVLMSGGVIRELVRIARACCAACLLIIRQESSRTDVVINDEILTSALRDLRNDLAVSLGASRYQILAMVYQNAKPEELTSEFLLLLHGLYILEYRNDEVWYDVHPLVVDLLRRAQLIN